MSLKGKNAIIYGGGGSVGGAVARAFGREGARVFLAGRTLTPLERVADRIRAAGGAAEVAEVDALDERSVDEHAAAVVAEAGGIDVSLNVIADTDVQGTPMVDMSLEDYLSPVVTAVRSKFLTSRAAARHMIGQRSGVIMFFGGAGDHNATRRYHLGGLLTSFDAVESMRRQLAVELGPHGIRVVTLRTGGLPETIPAHFDERGDIVRDIVGQTLIGRAASLEDVGDVAVFAASDRGRTLTGTALNITCGAVLD
ncbi:SDR family NAD(P)-dependent oxidoreductase [Streptosporangium sp. NPDC000095]|uniref:SDR family NAD(P)-dependent oxidoreductase n=1 Tax=Streptosporangium sp. NPDC000095 TaxID=3366184 RepID=UPI003697D008